MIWNCETFRADFVPPAIGMVHLPALPGSPGWAGSMEAVRKAALRDARALHAGGLRAIMVENYHDVPFPPGRAAAVTVAALAVVVADLRAALRDCRVGVNVLRNDVDAALAVAAATGAGFVRCNVHVGTAVTDQGTIEGRAWRTLRRRRELGLADGARYVGILADIRVKHASPLAARPLAEEARDLRLRGLADAIIITGPATGSGAEPEAVRCVREAVPECPVLVGSGVSARTVGSFLSAADGVIIGSALRGGDGVSAAKTAEFVAALGAADAGGWTR